MSRPTQRFCASCSNVLPENAPFCPNCGTAIGGGTSAAAVADDDGLLDSLRKELANDYEVERELGRGGMAIVYKASEKSLDRIVALKILPPDQATVGNTAERFKREARLAASLDHPNIIPVYRVAQAGPFFYMAMKFMEGKPLDDIIAQQGALPIPIVVLLLRAAARGLAFAHEKGIVHRDIKPANILVDIDGRVVVSDFGIARQADDKSLTASGTVIGTPYYMSPEQCGGQRVGPQSDQYSLGIVAFQALSGQVPFDAESMMGVIQHHFQTPPPDIGAVRQDVPKALADVMYKALAKDARDRFASTRAMADALDAIQISEQDRRDGETMLRTLSTGGSIAKIRTAKLGPLSLTASSTAPRGVGRVTTGPGPRSAPAKSGSKSSGGLIAIVGAVVLLGGGGAAWYFLAGPGKSVPPAELAAAPVVDPAPAEETPPATDPNAAPVADPSAAPAAAAAGPASLVFLDLPMGARVMVDNQPLAGGRGQVAPGTHSYAVLATGFKTATGTISVGPGESRDIPVSLQPAGGAPAAPSAPRAEPSAPTTIAGKGTLRIATDPIEAEISVDGKVVGRGRVIDQEIPAGQRRLRVALPGYAAFDTTFFVNPNDRVAIGQIRLRPN